MHANTFTHGRNPMGSYCKPYPFDQGWWSFFAIFPHFTTVYKLDGIRNTTTPPSKYGLKCSVVVSKIRQKWRGKDLTQKYSVSMPGPFKSGWWW